MAHSLLGRVLRLGGQAEPALGLFVEAQRLFEALGERGERMAAVTLAEQADCLAALGQLGAAAEKYKECIQKGEQAGRFSSGGGRQGATSRCAEEAGEV